MPLLVAVPLALVIGAFGGLPERTADGADRDQRLYHHARHCLGLYRHQSRHHRVDPVLQDAAGAGRLRRGSASSRFPYLLVAPLIVAALLGLFFARTVPGRQLLAYGGNAAGGGALRVSRASGWSWARMLSPGSLAAGAAVLAVAQLGSAQPTIGADWLLLSFAAPIIGGAALTGGSISVLGTMFAVILIALIENGMVLAKVDPYWVQFLLGALILAAVGSTAGAPSAPGRAEDAASRSIGSSKAFPGVQALDGVSFEPGAGRDPCADGRERRRQVDADQDHHRRVSAGRAASCSSTASRSNFASPHDALRAGISAVHQERNLIPRFSVGENILLERLPTRNGLVDYATIDREARRYLDLLDRSIDTRVEVRRLSVAQMQIVEIAKALSLEAKILLLDEPTASITEHETAALFTLLHRLRDEGVAIVFVSHKLEEVFAIADRVTVLRDGKNAAVGEPMAGMTRAKLVSLMIGREERAARHRRARADAGHRRAGGRRARTASGIGT